mgnify:CR=1 FL=1
MHLLPFSPIGAMRHMSIPIPFFTPYNHPLPSSSKIFEDRYFAKGTLPHFMCAKHEMTTLLGAGVTAPDLAFCITFTRHHAKHASSWIDALFSRSVNVE